MTMYSKFKYGLEKHRGPSSKHTCPRCQVKKRFRRYVNIETQEMLAEDVGICDRINSCKYHKTPRDYFQSTGTHLIQQPQYRVRRPILMEEHEPTYHPKDHLKHSFKNHSHNNLVKFLHCHYRSYDVENAIRKYCIGTSKVWYGASIYWQIDKGKNIRGGKIMLYDPTTGKRNRNKKVTWVHHQLKLKDFVLKQCLFGEHNISDDSQKWHALVESEKTAIICSLDMPEYVWIATGGKHNFNNRMLKPLDGKKVVIFPDGDSHKDWRIKMSELALNTRKWCISDVVERNSNDDEKENGIDLADLLI